MLVTASGNGSWCSQVSKGKFVHFVFGIGCPMNIGFDGSENANLSFIDCSTSVYPIRPIVIRADASCVLKGDT